MSYTLSDEVLTSVRDLVVHITKFEEDSPVFKHVFTHFVGKLDAADSLFYVTQKEIDNSVKSLSDKFLFHSYHKQSADIKRLYEKFMEKSESKEETQTKLSVMKLLFCLSNSPTNFLANLPEDHELSSYTEEEEEIDWGKYLQEGIERWSPPPGDLDSEGWSEDEDENTFTKCYLADVTQPRGFTLAGDTLDETSEEDSSGETRVDSPESAQNLESLRRENRKKIIEDSIQNGWFNQNSIRMLPESTNIDAIVALNWEKHVSEITHGLIEYKANVITEYKIMREIIWQLCGQHSSICFKFSGNRLVSKEDICISSIRPEALHHFLCEFVPYIEILEEFREFVEGVSVRTFSSGTNAGRPPYTYLSYVSALESVLRPTYRSLLDIEKTIMEQDDNVTLLKLGCDLRNLLKPVRILHKIHKEIIREDSGGNFVAAATVLVKLRQGLTIADSKVEQDIFLTLYLQSLTQYIYIVDKWLSTGSFDDERDEFPIVDNNVDEAVNKPKSQSTKNISFKEEGQQDWQMEFLPRKLPPNLKPDGLLDLITTEVIKIGKNVHLLDLLRKLHLLNQDKKIGMLHEEFTAKVLQVIAEYFGNSQEENVPKEQHQEVEIYKFPAFCPDFCKYTTEMDRLENLVDVSDGFLMLAFEEFFLEKEDHAQKKEEQKEETLYERISKVTRHTFPIQQTIENCFAGLLKERYSQSGRIIKNILLSKYQLQQHLLLLSHVFLFKDDFIFPFYRLIFEKIDKNAKCGNNVWLTSNLQDILMDIHPNHYDKVRVVVKDAWHESLHDPLSALNMLKPHYRIEWPVNIIIRHENLKMYKEMFKFIIIIKWGLYTLNHLHFNDIESKKRGKKKVHKSLRILRGRLNCLRFGLLNIFSSIQHYVFGYVLHSTYGRFEQDLQDSHDLDSLISAHTRFISNLHRMSARVRDFEEKGRGFNLLGYLVRQLRNMWRNVYNVEEKDLSKYERLFAESFRNLSEILNPKDLGLD